MYGDAHSLWTIEIGDEFKFLEFSSRSFTLAILSMDEHYEEAMWHLWIKNWMGQLKFSNRIVNFIVTWHKVIPKS